MRHTVNTFIHACFGFMSIQTKIYSHKLLDKIRFEKQLVTGVLHNSSSILDNLVRERVK